MEEQEVLYEFEPLPERRPRSRLWIPVVAVVFPVAAFVVVAAWFIRAFIAPPMVHIPSPGMLAALPTPPPAPALMARAEAPAPPEPTPVPAAHPIPAPPVSPAAAMRETTASATPADMSSSAPGTSMLASITAAPPMLASASRPVAPAAPPAAPMIMASMPPPMATVAPNTAVLASPMAGDQPAQADDVLENSEPIKGKIPLPRHRPRVVAHVALGSAVPLPRPRPGEAHATPETEAPSFDRHSIQ